MEWLTDFRWIIYLCVNVDMIIAFKKRKIVHESRKRINIDGI